MAENTKIRRSKQFLNNNSICNFFFLEIPSFNFNHCGPRWKIIVTFKTFFSDIDFWKFRNKKNNLGIFSQRFSAFEEKEFHSIFQNVACWKFVQLNRVMKKFWLWQMGRQKSDSSNNKMGMRKVIICVQFIIWQYTYQYSTFCWYSRRWIITCLNPVKKDRFFWSLLTLFNHVLWPRIFITLIVEI